MLPKPIKANSWNMGVNRAKSWFHAHPGKPQLLFEQNRNLGDTLHLIPIIRHYRLRHPNAKIVFIIGRAYLNAHRFNPDIDQIITVPTLDPQSRINFRRKLLSLPNIRVIAPSIFPYGSVWPELTWSYPNIADQYLHNAGIKDLNPKGGRKLEITLTPEDRRWAENFLKKHKIEGKFLCSLEYISYSHTPSWNRKHFSVFVTKLSQYGVKCISFSGPKEHAIAGSVSAAGCTWRQTVALMEYIHVHVGIGSGVTMLAAAAQNQPKICEILIPKSITMKGCGYAPSIPIKNKNPKIVADHVWFKVLH